MDPGAEAGVTTEKVATVRVDAFNAKGPFMDSLVSGSRRRPHRRGTGGAEPVVGYIQPFSL